MKNKLLAVLLAMVVVLLAFASCQKCEHPLSEEWESDVNGHWHPTECEHGEFRGETESHVDADEDGNCDICAFKGAHIHTFASEWTITEDKHWKAATCSHTDVKGEESLHVDEDLNAVCDVCKGHVHVLDGAGFCNACNREIIPVDEFNIGSVISATTARTHNIKSADIYRYVISRNKNAELNVEASHNASFIRGTNGTYVKWEYPEVAYPEDDPDSPALPTGKTEVLEKWIEIVSPDTVKGISAISVDGAYKSAEPSAFGVDDLSGYYFAVSNLADGHGAEAVLLALYEVYEEYGVEDADIAHDAENNKYDFSFKALVVRKVLSGGVDLHEYPAEYFEVDISFTYADDYTLTYFSVECDCYTSDDSLKDDAGNTVEPDIEYNYDTGEFTILGTAIADTYKFEVTQEVGEREEIELNDGSEFTPTGYEIYTDKEYTTKMPASLTLEIADMNTEFYLKATPEDSFMSFLAFDFDITVTDEDGNPIQGLVVALYSYDVIQFFPQQGGKYKVTFEGLGQTETIDVTVNAPEVKGDKFFTVEVLESNSWSQYWGEDGVYYTFTPEAPGKYTFYFPANFGVIEKSKVDTGGYNIYPDIDPFNIDMSGGYDPSAEHSITVTLRQGASYSFYFGAVTAGVYTIGYEVN